MKPTLQYAREAVNLFWDRHPALAYGLAALIGCGAGLRWHGSLLLPIFLLVASTSFKQALLLSTLLIAAFICCATRFELPDLPEEGIAGTALISISSLSDSQSFVGSGRVLKGQLLHFQGAQEVRKGRFRLSIPSNWGKPHPDPAFNYVVKGQLRSLGGGSYSLKVSRHTPWLKEKPNYSLAERRYKIKKIASDYLKNQFKNPKVGSFFIGLTTGEFTDQQTQNALAKLGVQHLLAISGFHFALFAALFSIILRALLPRRAACILLMSALVVYFLFLGYGASISRAWLMITLVLLAEVLEFSAKGLNLIGAALLALLIWDPLSALEAGFQLSFLATGAILLLHPLLDEGLSRLWPKRPLSNLAKMNLWDQQGYIILCLFRQSLALILAVHIAVVPVCLYLFRTYPLIGFVTNLFYPFFAGLGLTWLVITIPIQQIIPPLGAWMHAANNAFTESLLGFAYNLPPRLQVPLQVNELSEGMVVLYTTLLLGVGILLRQCMEKANRCETV